MAYSEEERKIKKRQILNATAALLVEKEYQQIAVREIAEKLTISKGTLYNFFTSKEDIFLALYKVELESWLQELALVFTSGDSLEEILREFVHKHCQRHLFIKLMTCLNTVLEINLDSDVLRDFKFYLLEQVQLVAEKLDAGQSPVSGEDFGPFIIHYTAHFNGIYLMGRRSPNLLEVLKRHPELKVFAPELNQEMTTYVLRYFKLM